MKLQGLIGTLKNLRAVEDDVLCTGVLFLML